MLLKVGKALTSRLTLGVLVAVFAWLAWHEHFAKPPVKLVGQTQLNDSTVAAPASTSLGRHELPALTDAADKLNGKLIAGVSFHTKADTTVRPLKEVTTSTAAGDTATRLAVLDDTTAMGIVLHIDAKAPQSPKPIELGYNLVVPSFNPSVGFTQQGNDYAAVVTWGHQKVTIDHAFVVPQKRIAVVAGLNTLVDSAAIHAPDAYFGMRLAMGRQNQLTLSGVKPWGKPWAARVGIERELWSR